MRRLRKMRVMALFAVAAAIPALLPASSAATVGDVRPAANAKLGNDTAPARGNDGVDVAVNPSNPDNIVAVNGDWITFQCEYNVTLDGGQTWRGGRLRAPADFPHPCSPVGHGNSALGYAGVVGWGSGDNVYAVFASARQNAGQSVLVAKSTDGGQRFQRAVEAMVGGSSLAVGPDYRFPKLVVEPDATDGDNIYIVAYSTNAPIPPATPFREVVLGKSLDGGATWETPVQISTEGESAIEPSQPVKVDDTLYVAWRTLGFDGFIKVAESADDGATWTSDNAVPVQGFNSGTTQFTASSFPRLAGDETSGNVYLVYGQGPVGGGYPGQSTADHFIHPDMDVLFSRSTDGAETWSSPVAVNEPALAGEITQNRHPAVTVAADGRVDVVWHDRRHWYQNDYDLCTNTHGPTAGTAPCTEARLGDTYYAYSEDGGETWSENHRITDRSINNDVGFDYRFGAYWDFGPKVVDLGNGELFFAWMDSRLGNYQNDNMDLFYARANLNALGNAPVQRVQGDNHIDLSVRLSTETYPGGAEGVLAATFASQGWTRVVIANENDVPAALVGGVLGRANLGPVLLSPSDGLTADVEAEVERIEPIGAILIGDEASLGAGVVSDLEAAGVPSGRITRISGASLAETAGLVAEAMDYRTTDQETANVPAFDAAVVVNASSPTAATAAVLAANRRLPILFVEQNSVPQATQDALTALDIQSTLVIGGTAAVSDAVLAQLPGATRIGSNAVVGTSRAVATESIARGLPVNNVFVASDGDTMDQALLGAAAGRIGGLQIVARNGSVRNARNSIDALGLTSRVDRLIRVESA